MLGGDAAAGADCAGAVVADPFGCPLVTGCVYIDPGDDVLAAGCGCAVFTGCFCVLVCAAFGAAAAVGFCAAGGCLYAVVEAPLLFVFASVCPTPGAAHSPAHNRLSNRIQPARLIMESSGARRFHLHYDCVAILGIVSEYNPFPAINPASHASSPLLFTPEATFFRRSLPQRKKMYRCRPALIYST